MKRVLAVIVTMSVLFLAGCGLIFPPATPPPPFGAVFNVEVISPLTVAVDGRGSVGAQTFTWDWGDGTPPLHGGQATQVARHTYARPGRYVIILTVTGDPGAGGGGGDGGPGPAPYPPVAGTPGVASSYRVADLLKSDLPMPVMVILHSFSGMPSRWFHPASRVTFYAGESRGENLWYQWQVVRIDPATQQPIPYPWATEVRYYQSEQETFQLTLVGFSPCRPGVMTFRVRLWVTDEYGRRNMAETLVYTTNRP